MQLVHFNPHFSNTSKIQFRWIFVSIFISSVLMMIPIIVEGEHDGKFGKPFYICMTPILPSVLIVVFSALLYRKIKKIQDDNKALNEGDFATKETLKDVMYRAKVIMGISAVLVSSLVIYSFQHLSNVSIHGPGLWEYLYLTNSDSHYLIQI